MTLARRTLSRRRRVQTALVVAVSLVGLLPTTASALTLNPKASGIATLVAHQPVTAYCGENDAEWRALPDVAYWADPAHGAFYVDGLAYIEQHTIYLAPTVCADLNAWSKLAGGAALVVTHEAIHVALASHDEALTECVAGRNVWPAIRALNLPRKTEKAAYREAMREHESLAGDPSGTYAWKGHC